MQAPTSVGEAGVLAVTAAVVKGGSTRPVGIQGGADPTHRGLDRMEEEKLNQAEKVEEPNGGGSVSGGAGGGGGGGWGGWGLSSLSVFSDLQKAAEEISRSVRLFPHRPFFSLFFPLLLA